MDGMALFSIVNIHCAERWRLLLVDIDWKRCQCVFEWGPTKRHRSALQIGEGKPIIAYDAVMVVVVVALFFLRVREALFILSMPPAQRWRLLLTDIVIGRHVTHCVVEWRPPQKRTWSLHIATGGRGVTSLFLFAACLQLWSFVVWFRTPYACAWSTYLCTYPVLFWPTSTPTLIPNSTLTQHLLLASFLGVFSSLFSLCFAVFISCLVANASQSHNTTHPFCLHTTVSKESGSSHFTAHFFPPFFSLRSTRIFSLSSYPLWFPVLLPPSRQNQTHVSFVCSIAVCCVFRAVQVSWSRASCYMLTWCQRVSAVNVSIRLQLQLFLFSNVVNLPITSIS